MKKSFSWVVLVVALVTFGGMPIAMAQTPDVTIESGNTLWSLQGIYSPEQAEYRALVILNPFLAEEGRSFVDSEGRFIVILKPGEVLRGTGQITGALQIPKAVQVGPPSVSAMDTEEATSNFPWWMWLVLAAIVLGMIALAVGSQVLQNRRERREQEAREREMWQDPIASGPPIVAGGVQPNETERLARALETAAVTEYVRMNPGVERSSVRVERIGPVEAGIISGEGMVGYADRARPRRIDPPQPGYRARFRFPDGREDFLMSLQGCMNPCYYGEGLLGFMFVPRQQVLPTPEPPIPAPQPVPHPAIAIRRIREAAQEEGLSTVTIGGRIITVERGVHFTVGDDGSITMSGAGFEMAVRPKRIVKPRRVEAPRTASDTQ